MIPRQSAAGHDTVHVRMPLQGLSPGMQDAEKADLRTEVLWIGSYFEQSSAAGFEQVNRMFLFCQIRGASACGTLKTR